MQTSNKSGDMLNYKLKFCLIFSRGTGVCSMKNVAKLWPNIPPAVCKQAHYIANESSIQYYKQAAVFSCFFIFFFSLFLSSETLSFHF